MEGLETEESDKNIDVDSDVDADDIEDADIMTLVTDKIVPITAAMDEVKSEVQPITKRPLLKFSISNILRLPDREHIIQPANIAGM